MKLIHQSAKLIPQEEGIEGIYKQIEKAGRVCYKSEHNITHSSAKPFVQRLIESGHTAMLEHGTVYLMIRRFLNPKDTSELSKYKHNPYSYYNELVFGDNSKGFYVTTNYRVLLENNWLDDLQYICEPTEFHEKRHTMRLVTSIGIVRELLRHRKFSFANESTRYCNYSTGKFNNQVTFILPYWIHNLLPETSYNKLIDDLHYLEQLENEELERKAGFFTSMCIESEQLYLEALNEGAVPQDIRGMLTLDTKSELVMTGFESDWKNFFDLRLYGKTGEPHPDMLLLAQLIKDEFKKNDVMF